jgi:hypothetical protein
MEKIYYTIEGKPYILKSVTKNNTSISGLTLAHYPTLILNFPAVPDPVSDFSLKNSKKIIPVSASLGIFDIANNICVFDFNSPFYNAQVGNPLLGSFYGTRAIAKSLSLIERSFYTDDFHLAYKFEYGEATYSEGDFIPTNAGLQISFQPQQALGTTISSTGVFLPLNAGLPYNTALTITYFEMLND